MARFFSRTLLLFSVFIAIFCIFIAIYPFYFQENEPKETKSVIFLVLDGAGAKYIEGLDAMPLEIEGAKIEKAKLLSIASASFTTAEQEFTETISAHSLYYIAGDCGKQWQDIKYCVDNSGTTTICDFYRSKGYLCIMVSEAGDFKEARNEFDVVLYDKGIFSFDVEVNSNSKEAVGVGEFLKDIVKAQHEQQSSDINFYVMYSAFIIETDAKLVKFMREKFPSKKFFLFSNAKGIDLCGHKLGLEAYISCIEGLDATLSSLANSRDSNTIIFITADHGMVFDCANCKGHHADSPENPYAREIPLILFGSNALLRKGTASDIMATVFEISGFPNACAEMRYCEGKSLLVSEAN